MTPEEVAIWFQYDEEDDTALLVALNQQRLRRTVASPTDSSSGTTRRVSLEDDPNHLPSGASEGSVVILRDGVWQEVIAGGVGTVLTIDGDGYPKFL